MNGQQTGSLIGGFIGLIAGSVIPYAGMFAAPMFAAIGATLGGLVGGALDPIDPVRNEQESIAGLMLQTSTFGSVLPMIWEKGRVAGNVWYINGPFVEETTDSVGGSSGGGGTTTTVTKTYFIDLAIGLCDTLLTGEMEEIRKIWADGNLIFNRTYDDEYPEGLTFYSGAAVQAPSPMIEAVKGAGNVPGYPFHCYITWFNYKMGYFPRVPNFTFELAQRGAAISSLHQMTWRPSDNSIWGAAPSVNQVLVYNGTTQDQTHAVKVDLLTIEDPTNVSKPRATPAGFPMAWENGSDALWIAHPYDYNLKRIDATTKAITHIFPVSQSLRTGGIYHSGDMWFCAATYNTGGGFLIRVNTLGIVATITMGQAEQMLIKAVATPTHIWVTAQHYPYGGGNSSAKRVDPATNTITATVVTGSSSASRPIDITTTPANNHIWVLDGIANTVIRINTTPAITATIAVGAVPLELAVASDGYVWVATTFEDGTVYRINPSTNTAVAYESLRLTQYNQAQPIMVAGDAGSMWVLSTRTGTVQRFAPNGTSIVVKTGGTSHSLVAQGATHVWTGTTRGVVQKITMAGVIEEAPGAANPRLRQMITKLCGAAGIPPEELALSGIQNPIVALKLTSIQAVRAALELIMTGYQIFATESGSLLKFRSREPGAVVVSIPAEDLDAYDASQNSDPPMAKGLVITQIPDEQLPTQLRFTYQSANRNYMDETLMVYVSNSRAGQVNPRAVSLQLVMRGDMARQVAQETLDQLWLQRMNYQFSIPRTYAYLEPGDRIQVTSRTLTHTMVLSEVSYRRPGILECVARGDIAGQIGLEQSFASGGSFDNNEDFLEHTIGHLVNLPAMHVTDLAPRYHVGYQYGDPLWPGAALLRSPDGIGYSVAHSGSEARATTGLVAVALAAGTPYVIDEVRSFSVVLNTSIHTLSSISDAALIAGGNRAMLGDEVLHFGVATLTAPRTYTCSRLIRGQRGTEWAIGTHGANESFMLLNSAVYEIGMAIGERNVARNYKTVTNGVQVSEVTAESFTATSENLTPWAVGSPQAHLVSGDWVLTWIARSRFPGEWTDGQSFAFDSDITGYRVQIYTDGTFATLMRTINVALGVDPESLQTTNYTIAMQTADSGGPPVVPLYWQVRAVGTYGVGRALELTGVS